ncbi:restriction endonuclease subunit S [Lentimicrobium sp. S6]|uniref:restriction endonuclease subunit S n=1 Tax=Lentimicrobium sp. S6 TaxID=2735872 RepID=UPI0015548F36|nr:restriction endonuclease subunit S [Lentimicrobium sp. S6]NPD47108.1 restriction endonuclease subunit S [Lentimicrobium sp. S6]
MREGWEIKLLGEVCDILDNKRKPITKRNRVKGNIPYYGATGILSYVKDYIFNEQLILLGEDGAKWESGDKSAFLIKGKTWVNNHAHVIKPFRNLLDDNWLIYYLNFQDLSPFISGMTVPKLNQGNMRKIQVPIPPLQIQKQIVSILDQAFAAIDQAKANTEKNIINAKELFQSKLNEVFSQSGEGWEEKKLKD